MFSWVTLSITLSITMPTNIIQCHITIKNSTIIDDIIKQYGTGKRIYRIQGYAEEYKGYILFHRVIREKKDIIIRIHIEQNNRTE